MSRSTLTLLLIAALSSFPLAGCTSLPSSRVNVLFAGSLILPFHELEQAFEAEHPTVDVLMEGHGSIQVVRHITEIHDLVDVAAVADHSLIPMLMFPNRVPETGRPYANWHINFATNRLALAYSPQSRHADEIDGENWFEIIARPDVRVGFSDPRLDACGYRTLMVLQMAEGYYGDRTIFEDVLSGRFTRPIQVRKEGQTALILVPEILETVEGSNLLIRGASIQLIALLESGDLDYAFEYESVIQQHGLKTVSLPQALNLGSEAHAQAYRDVQVQLDFRRFASVEPVFQGEVIQYGVTIPSNAPNPEGAEAFLAFLLGPQGRAVLESNAHPLILPPEAHHHSRLPTRLQDLCVSAP